MKRLPLGCQRFLYRDAFFDIFTVILQNEVWVTASCQSVRDRQIFRFKGLAVTTNGAPRRGPGVRKVLFHQASSELQSQGRFCLHALHAMHALELAKMGYLRVKMGVCMPLNFEIGRNEVLACP